MGSKDSELSRCPRCGQGWPSKYTVCPDDGKLLVRAERADVHDAATVLGTHESVGLSDDRTDITAPPVGQGPSEKASKSPAANSPLTKLVRRAQAQIELPPGTMLDEYEIERRLRTDAMGQVYSARNIKLGQQVALKVMSPRSSEDRAEVQRFEQDARTLSELHHPGIAEVLAFGELADKCAYFVMEYLEGESLAETLARGRMDEDEALEIFDQMARALEAAHRHNVIHRDLKPENTFLARGANEQRPTVKLLDFGLTAMSLSPEQTRGSSVDHRTDIYALGCVGYELFLGQSPFKKATTDEALIAAHANDLPPLPRTVSSGIAPQLDLLLFAMLAKDPAYRPTLTQIRAVIGGIRALPPIMGSLTPHPSRVAQRAENAPVARNTSRAILMMSVLALLAGFAIGAVAFKSKGAPAPAAAAKEADAAPAVGSDAAAAPADGVAPVIRGRPSATRVPPNPMIPPRTRAPGQ